MIHWLFCIAPPWVFLSIIAMLDIVAVVMLVVNISEAIKDMRRGKWASGLFMIVLYAAALYCVRFVNWHC